MSKSTYRCSGHIVVLLVTNASNLTSIVYGITFISCHINSIKQPTNKNNAEDSGKNDGLLVANCRWFMSRHNDTYTCFIWNKNYLKTQSVLYLCKWNG